MMCDIDKTQKKIYQMTSLTPIKPPKQNKTPIRKNNYFLTSFFAKSGISWTKGP